MVLLHLFGFLTKASRAFVVNRCFGKIKVTFFLLYILPGANFRSILKHVYSKKLWQRPLYVRVLYVREFIGLQARGYKLLLSEMETKWRRTWKSSVILWLLILVDTHFFERFTPCHMNKKMELQTQ